MAHSSKLSPWGLVQDLQNKVKTLGALVFCSSSKHIFCCTLLTLRCACVCVKAAWKRCEFSHKASIEPCPVVSWCLIMTEGSPKKAEPCRGFILTCQCQEAPNIPAREAARNGWSMWTKHYFLSYLFLVSDHFVTARGIRTTSQTCWITDFQGTCNPRCWWLYCALQTRARSVAG